MEGLLEGITYEDCMETIVEVLPQCMAVLPVPRTFAQIVADFAATRMPTIFTVGGIASCALAHVNMLWRNKGGLDSALVEFHNLQILKCALAHSSRLVAGLGETCREVNAIFQELNNRSISRELKVELWNKVKVKGCSGVVCTVYAIAMSQCVALCAAAVSQACLLWSANSAGGGSGGGADMLQTVMQAFSEGGEEKLGLAVEQLFACQFRYTLYNAVAHVRVRAEESARGHVAGVELTAKSDVVGMRELLRHIMDDVEVRGLSGAVFGESVEGIWPHDTDQATVPHPFNLHTLTHAVALLRDVIEHPHFGELISIVAEELFDTLSMHMVNVEQGVSDSKRGDKQKTFAPAQRFANSLTRIPVVIDRLLSDDDPGDTVASVDPTSLKEACRTAIIELASLVEESRSSLNDLEASQTTDAELLKKKRTELSNLEDALMSAQQRSECIRLCCREPQYTPTSVAKFANQAVDFTLSLYTSCTKQLAKAPAKGKR